MSNEELGILTQAIFQITGITGVLFVFFVFIIKMIMALSLFITKKSKSLKLKKYELEKYDIHFDMRGIPTTLVDKKNNKVIFI